MWNRIRVRDKFRLVAAALIVSASCLLVLEESAISSSPERIKQMQTSLWTHPQPEDFSEYLHYLINTSNQNVSKDKLAQDADSLPKIRQLLKSADLTKATKAALMLKIVHLYEQKSLEARKLDAEKYALEFDRWEIRRIFHNIPAPTPNYKASRQLIRKAIDAMRNLLDEYPAFGNNQAQLVQMGSLQLSVRNTNAELYLLKAIKLNQKSNWAAFARLALANHYFYQGKKKQAVKLLRELQKSRVDGVWQYARYLMPWLGVDLSQTTSASKPVLDSAAKSWQQLITSGKMKGRKPFKGSAAQKRLVEIIARDLVWVWSELGDLKAKKKFFATAKRLDLYYDLLERYGWKLQQQGKIDQASDIYHKIFKEVPDRFGYAKLNFRLIQSFFKKNQTQKLANIFQGFAAIVYNLSSPWNRAKFRDKDHRDFVRSVLKRELIQKGKFYEKRYQQSKDRLALLAINVLYHAYLKLFPKSAEAYDIHMQYAVSHELLGKLGDAVFHYHEVVNYKVRNPSHRKLAAEKMISIQRRLIAAEKFKPIELSGKISKPQKIPKVKQFFIQIGKTYLNYFPSGPQATPVRFFIARYFFEYGHYVNAMKFFESTVQTSPTSKEAKEAVPIVLGYFELHKRWRDLASWSERFLKFESKLGPQVAALMISKLRMALWNIAEGHVAKKERIPAAKAFLYYQKRLPRDARADLALYRAMGLYLQAGRGREGIKVGQKMLALYKSSPHAANTVYLIGKTFKSLNLYREAAEMMEHFATTFPRDKRTPEVLYEASQTYRGLKNLDRAALILQALATKYPKDKRSPGALLENAKINLDFRQEGAALKAYQKYLQIYSQVSEETTLFVRAQVFKLSTGKGKPNLNNGNLLKLESELLKKPRSFAVRARQSVSFFYLGVLKAKLVEFGKQKVAYYDFNEYSSSINLYMSNLAAIENIFARLLKVAANPSVVEAYYRLAELYEVASKEFSKEWNYDGLTAADLKKIDEAKERNFIILREKMTQSFLSSYQWAQKNKVFSEYRNKSLNRLAELFPTKYKKSKESVAPLK